MLYNNSDFSDWLNCSQDYGLCNSLLEIWLLNLFLIELKSHRLVLNVYTLSIKILIYIFLRGFHIFLPEPDCCALNAWLWSWLTWLLTRVMFMADELAKSSKPVQRHMPVSHYKNNAVRLTAHVRQHSWELCIFLSIPPFLTTLSFSHAHWPNINQRSSLFHLKHLLSPVFRASRELKGCHPVGFFLCWYRNWDDSPVWIALHWVG